MATVPNPRTRPAAERARERDVCSYYPLSLDITDLRSQLENAPHGLPLPGYEPRPSEDGALTAFAQLGAHRIDADRAFISLIDSQSQIVLAEATKTVPLGNTSIRAIAENFYLGSAIIPRAWGICECALDDDALVVADLHLEPRFRDRPFVQSAPNIRFYAGVPLKTLQGTPIGVYCVVDDKPRDGLGENQLLFMQDVATTVVSYLSAARAHATNRKAEKMVRGLTSFVTGAADLQARDDLNMPRTQEHPTSASPSPPPGPRRRPERTASEDSTDTQRPDVTDPPQDSLLSPGTKRMFSRAAHIMRESSELDGVIFFDASVANAGAAPESPVVTSTDDDDETASQNPTPIIDESSESITSSTSSVRQPTCRILGFADESLSSRHGGAARKDYLGFTETSLRRLLRGYPHGKIYNIERSGAENTPVKRTSKGRMVRSTAVDAIVDVAHNARSAAIIPLWDYERQRWFAGCLCWTSTPARILSYGSDLLYLRAFGNSIMAELARIDAIAIDKAKTSFIESMSHELRSPLHGILGGVEYLQGMRLDAFQITIANSIAMCGRTLLDTVQNVLEYSKINEFTGPYSKNPASGAVTLRRSSLGPLGTDPAVNIRLLTEETVEAVFAGQSYNLASSPCSEDGASYFSEPTSPVSTRSRSRPPLRKAVRVILDLPARSCWTYAVQPGIWRRILMNVFGNALRFTQAGYVRVSLSAVDVDELRSHITLTVTDSGPGMSSKYIQDGLFKPFSQQDTFSHGTGLGMSIVQRLVQSLGGEVSVESRIRAGTGTVVTIRMTLPKCDEAPDKFVSTVAAHTDGMQVAVARTTIPFNDEIHKLECSSELQFHNALIETLRTSFGIKVVALDDVGVDDSQLIMYPGPSFNSMFKRRSREGVSMVVAMDGMEAATLRADQRVKSGWIDVVTQPCGPSKLARILERYLFLLNKQSAAPVRADVAKSPPTIHGTFPRGAVRPVPFRRRISERRSIQLHTSMTAPAETHPHDPDSPPMSPPQAPSSSNPQHQPNGDERTGETETHTPPAQSDESSTCANRILIVDDNPLNIRLLSAFLNRAGFTQHTSASNGLEALNIFKEDPTCWATVLMDLSMPVMDGVTATREIRAWERRMAADNPVLERGTSASPAGGPAPPLLKKALTSKELKGQMVREWRDSVTESSSDDDDEQERQAMDIAGVPTPNSSTPGPFGGSDRGEAAAEDEDAATENEGAAPAAETTATGEGGGPADPGGASSSTPPPDSSMEHFAPLPPPPPPPPPSDTPLTEAQLAQVEQRPPPPSLPNSYRSLPTRHRSRDSKGSNVSKRNNANIGRSNHNGVQIIVITGLGSATARFEATSAGADVFMTKPIQFGALMKTLKGRLRSDG